MSEAGKLANIAIADKPDLAKYELLDELGHGGMATVYRAHDRRLDREVAVKIIHRHLRENAEVATRFTAEARAVAKLRHPNIVDVYDVSDPGESERYLVVELVRGTTLRRLLATEGHLPAEIAAIISIEVGEALAHAHEHGVIHRDVKPENVLLDLDRRRVERESEHPQDRRSRIKLTDFGIAKVLDAQGVTSTGQVLGSPAHMSPEQIEGGNVGERSDVFGLGVMLYECLVGVLPFEGKNPAQVLRRVLDGAFTPADRARPTVGAGFGRVVGRALAHAPEDRYASIAEMVDELRSELARVGFEDTRRELDEYLLDPSAYTSKHGPRVITQLVELGRRARLSRNVFLAAACFNRALAHRPDDLELLRLVSGLAKAERFRHNVRAGALAAGVLAVLFAVTYVAVLWLPTLTPLQVQAAGGEDPIAPRGPSVRVAREPEVPARPPPTAAAVTPPTRRAPPRSAATPSAARPTPPPTGKQLVKVMITGGAIGGYVVVDGAHLASGDARELQLGKTYAFEFRPPDDNADCCAITTHTFEITPDLTVVEASVPFHKATIVASRAPPDSVINCAPVGKGTTPNGMGVALTEPSLTVTCSIVPPAESGLPPREKTVELTPGATVDLWP